MALTFPRWIALAVMGMAMTAAIILRDRPARAYVPSARERLASKRNLALMQAQFAGDELRQRQLIDSVNRVLSLRQALPGNVFIDPSLPTPQRAAVETVLAVVGARRSGSTLAASPVVVVADRHPGATGTPPAMGYPGSLAFNYVLPDRGSTQPCLVVARLRLDAVLPTRRSWQAELASSTTTDRFLGPCAFYEAFGAPGVDVDGWLRSRAWSFGLRGNFVEATGKWTPPEWDRDGFRLHSLLSPQGLGCVAGDDDMCVTALTEPETNWRLRVVQDNWVTTARFNPFTQPYTYGREFTFDFGPREWTLLSDMVRDLGPERFAAFWRSSQPMPQAFQSAAGKSLPQWTREWVVTTYGAPSHGPLVTRNAAAFSVLLVALAIAAATAIARRRVLA